MFEKGRPFELKDHMWVEGVSREMHFYPSTRSDGLTKRQVIVGKKIMEYFHERDDRLIYRSATFDPTMMDDIVRLSDGKSNIPIRKMCQKYQPNPSEHSYFPTHHAAVPADKDVFKITFYLDQKKVC